MSKGIDIINIGGVNCYLLRSEERRVGEEC